ncbi:CheR family methyltransferase [Desulfoferrobacter suflitae]|uniref:CheR family methyltransferase n=1 Tax=Desulfoferrobacter suflitae TaxID=2865782 RepID=UPI002164AD7D|nr:protein-glutamate O-methyltransferase [Desulfoferrobacter suflitae]MCK8602396.1 protein-glutamate O-methyltransferase [Desulfoferrobacter suflitae]
MQEAGLPDHLFEKYSELVYRECGINLHQGKRALLQARLNKRLRATKLPDYETYYRFLTARGNTQELIQFLDCIATNLTYFFREIQHMKFLEQILPDLLAEKSKRRDCRLRVWSAGCSSGEEPYSLAMCILPHLDDFPECDFRILATDISTRALAVAARGIYPKEKVLKVPEPLRSRYFRPDPSDRAAAQYHVAQALKSIISFRRLNLKDAYPFKGPFDYIFCRNVMIYFDKSVQENLVNKMSAYLSPGGYLFVGHSESLMGLKHSLKYVRPAVYRK